MHFTLKTNGNTNATRLLLQMRVILAVIAFAAIAVVCVDGLSVGSQKLASQSRAHARFEGSEHKRVVDEVFAKFKDVSNTKFNHKKLDALLAAENVIADTSTTVANPETLRSEQKRNGWLPFASKPKVETFQRPTQFHFSLGQAVAMAGDYYGT